MSENNSKQESTQQTEQPNPSKLTDEEKQAIEQSVNAEITKLAQEKNWSEKVVKMQRPKKLQSALDEAQARKTVVTEKPELNEAGKEKELEKAVKKKLEITRANSIVVKARADVATAQKTLVTSVENLVIAEQKLENAEKGKSTSKGIPVDEIEKLKDKYA